MERLFLLPFVVLMAQQAAAATTVVVVVVVVVGVVGIVVLVVVLVRALVEQHQLLQKKLKEQNRITYPVFKERVGGHFKDLYQLIPRCDWRNLHPCFVNFAKFRGLKVS